MNRVIGIMALSALSIVLVGCVNNAEKLGAHVAKLQTEQTYNPNATIENLGVVPTGSGERMEGVYQTYTGKKDSELAGTDSQILEQFGQ
ncbi:hypothetical protein [Vibrio ouci]|uniref:Lipoprotein n=1 Tax=Vibrio ouci TaxID=2499078 RepID=A0A4Y8WCB0_9VIBR|nr:hypothetical protein [Vibrio ouci]TFH90028.1 hypothetical protein ELS82_19090 [Vibrio ouci]